MPNKSMDNMTNSTNSSVSKYFLILSLLLFLGTGLETVKAQTINGGVDFYSTYVWRGVAYAGPSVQPTVEFDAGGFSLGAWGSQGFNGYQEMDLYTAYSFDFGLSLGVTDYYYPGPPTFFQKDAHAFELNGSYGIGDVSLSGNYIFAGGGSVGDDVYFQLGYSVGKANLFVGGGNGWHSTDTDFKVVNIGVGTTKEIKITDSFSIPLNGSVILNPDTEELYIVAGISL